MSEEEKEFADEIMEADVAEEEEDAGTAMEASDTEKETVAIAPIDEPEIRDLIYTVRGVQIMLDSDIAQLYQVETKNLNRAAKRNDSRFPEDFRFQLTQEEQDALRCQIGTSNDGSGSGRGGRRYLPYAYTEQGVAMLSAVLRSQVAIDASVRIMRAFVEMRHFIASNAAMFEQVRGVELKLLEYQKTTDERFERVFDYMEAHEAPKQKVFFDGQVYDAFELLVSIVQRAERSIVLVDGYVDAGTLNILAKKRDGVEVTVWTNPRTRLTERDVETFNAQYPQLVVEHTTAFHDRFLILDGKEGYFVGASLKDAGKRAFAISRIEDAESVDAILARLER